MTTMTVEAAGSTDLPLRSPSLAAELPSAFAEAYRLGRPRAAAETGIAAGVLPTVPPFTLDEARDEAFLPLEPSLELYRRAPQR